jgi:RNA polymerase sigma factor (sigma-70 family)
MQRLLEGRERFLAFLRARLPEPDLAEDVLQNSLLKAIQALPELRDEERLIPWFYAVLRNAAIDAYRRKGAGAKQVPLESAEDVALDEETHGSLCECVNALIPTLKPEYRELIRVLELGEELPEQAASRLNITPGNLKVRRHRARQALRRRLEETCRVCAEHHCLDCTCTTVLGQQ